MMTGALLFLVAVFLALGTWQVQRLSWKLDLIARVEARINAPAVPAPARSDWGAVTREKDEYRRVTASGTFSHDKSTLVQAVTELGAGFWVLTPMRLEDGWNVLINRGFVPVDRRNAAERAEGDTDGATTVTGLLRVTEPGGAFLRSMIRQTTAGSRATSPRFLRRRACLMSHPTSSMRMRHPIPAACLSADLRSFVFATAIWSMR